MQQAQTWALFTTNIMYVYVCARAKVHTRTQQPQDNLGELIVSFHMGPQDQTQVVRLCARHPDALSHLFSPFLFLRQGLAL